MIIKGVHTLEFRATFYKLYVINYFAKNSCICNLIEQYPMLLYVIITFQSNWPKSGKDSGKLLKKLILVHVFVGRSVLK